MKFFDGLLIVAEIFLAADQNDGKALAEMEHLGDPLDFPQLISFCSCSCTGGALHLRVTGVLAYLLLYIVQRIWRVDGETNENDMGIWIGQRAQTIVIFLACRIP